MTSWTCAYNSFFSSAKISIIIYYKHVAASLRNEGRPFRILVKYQLKIIRSGNTILLYWRLLFGKIRRHVHSWLCDEFFISYSNCSTAKIPLFQSRFDCFENYCLKRIAIMTKQSSCFIPHWSKYLFYISLSCKYHSHEIRNMLSEWDYF